MDITFLGFKKLINSFTNVQRLSTTANPASARHRVGGA